MFKSSSGSGSGSRLPDDLLRMALKAGAQEGSIKRYEETYRIGGWRNTVWSIRVDTFFRLHWHHRNKWKSGGDLSKTANDLAKGYKK